MLYLDLTSTWCFFLCQKSHMSKLQCTKKPGIYSKSKSGLSKIYRSIIQANFFEVCSLFSVLIKVYPAHFACLKSSEVLLHLSQLYFLTRLLVHLVFPTFVFFHIFIQKSIKLFFLLPSPA